MPNRIIALMLLPLALASANGTAGTLFPADKYLREPCRLVYLLNHLRDPWLSHKLPIRCLVRVGPRGAMP